MESLHIHFAVDSLLINSFFDRYSFWHWLRSQSLSAETGGTDIIFKPLKNFQKKEARNEKIKFIYRIVRNHLVYAVTGINIPSKLADGGVTGFAFA